MAALLRSSLWRRPSTRLGWWALGLCAAFTVMFVINSAVFMSAYQDASNNGWRQAFLPFYGIFMILCGFAAGLIGLIAVILKHDRSWLVWLTILPGAFVVFLVLGEFLVPH